MRNWKILLGSTALIGVTAIAAFTLRERGPAAASAAAASGPPAMPVPVTTVERRTLPVYLDYAARTESIREVSLQAKVSGYIQAQPTDDGADVKEGDLLYKIDDRDYRAALDQA